jgi:hypothetical protein
MLKKSLYFVVLAIFVIAVLAFVAIAPYHIYTLTLTEGLSTSFLELKPSEKSFYDGDDFKYFGKKELENDNVGIFSNLHFSNFVLPFPTNSSVFNLIPVIKNESGGPRLGVSYMDNKRNELFYFIVETPTKFDTTSGNQKLFILPVFKNHILRKSLNDLWGDLFYKKLTLPSNLGKSFLDSLMSLKSVSYSDLVYNLYILYNRDRFFPEDTKNIAFNPSNNQGLITLKSFDESYRSERIYLNAKGMVYSVSFKTKIGNFQAERFRDIFLKTIAFKESTVDSSIPIYAQYKSIPFAHRLEQRGMTYLYTAWSHDVNNRDYIRVIIYFLERGSSNLKYLKPFYEYSYKKFGSNFSGEDGNLDESAEEKLKRKSKEELEKEIRSEEGNSKPKSEGSFNSNEEKIKYYLQKAKDSKKNSDDDQKMLIQE